MMASLSTLLDIAIIVFAVTSTLSVGLRYTIRQLVGPLRNAEPVNKNETVGDRV
jgi:hypothetical protein